MWVLRYDIEQADYQLGLFDQFVVSGTTVSTDSDQAKRFCSLNSATEYASGFVYPYPLKAEEVFK